MLENQNLTLRQVHLARWIAQVIVDRGELPGVGKDPLSFYSELQTEWAKDVQIAANALFDEVKKDMSHA